ncbi:MAG: C40 family peptidase [Armatimonadetes bacterium]|nr:C40 family peptidase [Armatimonadota bacterium]
MEFKSINNFLNNNPYSQNIKNQLSFEENNFKEAKDNLNDFENLVFPRFSLLDISQSINQAMLNIRKSLINLINFNLFTLILSYFKFPSLSKIPKYLKEKSIDITSRILKMAKNHRGEFRGRNTCASTVNQVLKESGIKELNPYTKGNSAWVPNYKNLGVPIKSKADLRPGDLVITRNWGHIGIYEGNGSYWNVSSSSGYRWKLNRITDFTEGRRIV